MTKNAIEPSARRSPRSRAIGARRPATPLRRSAVDPATTLAADYLDHFNQAILLLELLAATPDCAGNFHAWRPRGHQDCLQSLLEEERAAALAAYRALDPRLRARFETLTASMTEVLVAAQEVMQSTPHSPALGMLANRAALWVTKLVGQARALIDGSDAVDPISGAGIPSHAAGPARP